MRLLSLHVTDSRYHTPYFSMSMPIVLTPGTTTDAHDTRLLLIVRATLVTIVLALLVGTHLVRSCRSPHSPSACDPSPIDLVPLPRAPSELRGELSQTAKWIEQ